jgi:succinyl-CoA synthetase alpha subunit
VTLSLRARLGLIKRFSSDDLTVQVIFFGNGAKAEDKAAGIVVNQEATGPPAQPVKAKL